jgi:hypothetical protein
VKDEFLFEIARERRKGLPSETNVKGRLSALYTAIRNSGRNWAGIALKIQGIRSRCQRSSSNGSGTAQTPRTKR